MHRPPLSSITLFVACAGILGGACSGAEMQDVLFDDSASSSSNSSSTGGGSNPPNPSTSSGENPSSASSSSGATDVNRDCEHEEEPNDDEGSANVLAPARCGTLSDDDTVDFLVFRIKQETKSMSLNFKGNIRLTVRVDGQVIELSPSNVGNVPFVRDADYVIELAALSKGDVPWRIEVVEK